MRPLSPTCAEPRTSFGWLRLLELQAHLAAIASPNTIKSTS